MVSSDGYIHVHHALMAIAWQVFFPAAIFVARYLKPKLKEKWFPVHIGLSMIGVALTLSGKLIKYFYLYNLFIF
jgi:ABC-type transport system involved in cytochrome c biogenesis permease subunit